MQVFKTATIYKNWNEARKDARQKKGPVKGWMEGAGHASGYFFPIVCGTRLGHVVGPVKSAEALASELFA